MTEVRAYPAAWGWEAVLLQGDEENNGKKKRRRDEKRTEEQRRWWWRYLLKIWRPKSRNREEVPKRKLFKICLKGEYPNQIHTRRVYFVHSSTDFQRFLTKPYPQERKGTVLVISLRYLRPEHTPRSSYQVHFISPCSWVMMMMMGISHKQSIECQNHIHHIQQSQGNRRISLI